MQTKLTLRLENGLIDQAKAYARRRGKSISRMVADYFRALGRRPADPAAKLTPIVRSLKGSLRGSKVGVEEIKRHWEARYL